MNSPSIHTHHNEVPNVTPAVQHQRDESRKFFRRKKKKDRDAEDPPGDVEDLLHRPDGQEVEDDELEAPDSQPGADDEDSGKEHVNLLL